MQQLLLQLPAVAVSAIIVLAYVSFGHVFYLSKVVNFLANINHFYRESIVSRVTIRPGFPGHVLFLAFVRASGRVFQNRRFVRVFGPIRKYIRTLPIAKAYDGMRPRKLVSFLHNMSVTSQNAILVQLSHSVYYRR